MHQQTQQQRTERNEFNNFLVDNAAQWFLTLHFNKTVTIRGAQHYIRQFFQRLDREQLGRNYLQKSEQRTSMFAFVEHVQTNTHWHCIGSLPFDQHQDLRECADTIAETWKALWPAGSSDLQPVTHTPRVLARYVTKELHKAPNRDAYIHSSMFWPSDQHVQLSTIASPNPTTEHIFRLEDLRKSTRRLRKWSSKAKSGARLSLEGRIVGLVLPLQLYDGALDELPILGKSEFKDPSGDFIKLLQGGGCVRVRLSSKRKVVVLA